MEKENIQIVKQSYFIWPGESNSSDLSKDKAPPCLELFYR